MKPGLRTRIVCGPTGTPSELEAALAVGQRARARRRLRSHQHPRNGWPVNALRTTPNTVAKADGNTGVFAARDGDSASGVVGNSCARPVAAVASRPRLNASFAGQPWPSQGACGSLTVFLIGIGSTRNCDGFQPELESPGKEKQEWRVSTIAFHPFQKPPALEDPSHWLPLAV